MSKLETQGEDDPLPVYVIQHSAQWENIIDKPVTSLELSEDREDVDSGGSDLLLSFILYSLTISHICT